MKLAVLGTGYLGTTHAAAMAQIGHDVVGVDIDPGKVAKLQAGEVPQNERDFGADLSHVDAAIDAVSPHLRRPALIVGKSTVPVGTAERLAVRVRRIAPAGGDVELAWNPEFLREGFAVLDTLSPDRIVVGVEDRPGSRAAKTLRELYSPILDNGRTPYLVTNLETAELVKVAANAFLATKISFINAISAVCDATSADVTMLSEAIGLDQRIGRRYLDAGLGFGGGCLPKDIRAFMARAEALGLDQVTRLLSGVDHINVTQRSRAVDAARESCGTLAGARVAVLGAAFKPNSDDIRDSPALAVACAVHREGADVTVFDPKAMANARSAFPELNYALSTHDACRDADVVLILTDWEEFRRIQPAELESVTRAKRIVDARNCLDPRLWRSAGWTYRSFGRPGRPAAISA